MAQVVSGIGHEGLPLYTKEQLADSASIRDGLEAHREVQMRRQYTHFITDLGKALAAPQWAIYTAVFLCHHYFAKRSLKRNDRYLVGTACLYLASKAQESPKYLRDVIKQAELRKWSRWQQEHPTEPRKWEDQAHLEAMRDQVLVAERAVLYTTSFQLRIKTPYNEILAWKEHIPKQHMNDILNIAWSLVNDSLWTKVSLIHPPEKIAATCIFLACEISGLPLPSKEVPGSDKQPPSRQGFCRLFNITSTELKEIAEELLDVYITVIAKDSAQDTASYSIDPSQPTSPESHLQLQENRVRFMPAQPQQQPPARPQLAAPNAARPGSAAVMGNDQQHSQHLQHQAQQQQQPQSTQQPNGSLQQHAGYS